MTVPALKSDREAPITSTRSWRCARSSKSWRAAPSVSKRLLGRQVRRDRTPRAVGRRADAARFIVILKAIAVMARSTHVARGVATLHARLAPSLTAKPSSTLMTYIGNERIAADNEVFAHLVLTGFIGDPTEITGRTLCEPTKTWRTGDAVGASSRRHHANGWQFTAPGGSNDVETSVDRLIQALGGSSAALVEISSEIEIELSIVVYARAYVPAIHLRADQIDWVSRLHASIDVDLYYQVEGA